MKIDIIIILTYLIVINFIALRYSRVKNINEYFLGGRSVSWILVCFSIVATETSTLTFISIPGLAYIKGCGFLQIAFGYIIGRILVSVILLPSYFEGNIETVYHFLQNRFGIVSRRVISVVFHITRLLADSVRLFATAIPLSFLMNWDYRVSIIIIAVATFIYTFFGGIKSVIIADSIQLFLYIICAFLGIFIISDILSLPFEEIFKMMPDDSFNIISTGVHDGWMNMFNSYNLFSGIIGGAILSFASHGTDHLIIQRILSCRDVKSAKKAMVFSGVIVFFQFAIFLLLGLFIKVLLKEMSFERSDEIIPFFIIEFLPEGVRGIMLAGIFAAAMSTLSSSINSLSSSTAIDILGIAKGNMSEEKQLRLSRFISLIWTVVLVGIAILLSDNKNPLVEVGLSIASVTYGGMLGIFLMGRLFRNFYDKAALFGAIAGIISTAIIAFYTQIFWPWFVCIGFIISFLSGVAVNYLYLISGAGRKQ